MQRISIYRQLLTIFFAIFLHTPTMAADIDFVFTDKNNQALSKVVVALVPAITKNFDGHPVSVMDQRNKMFVPDVLAVRVNTLVRFPNSDDIRHQVYSFSPAKKFELRLYHGMTAEAVLFDHPGKVVLGCNIHDSMIAYIYVVATEYFSVANETGLVQLKNIPAGDYQLEIYHPQLTIDYPVEKITFNAQQTLTKSIQLQGLSDPVQPKKSTEFLDLF